MKKLRHCHPMYPFSRSHS